MRRQSQNAPPWWSLTSAEALGQAEAPGVSVKRCSRSPHGQSTGCLHIGQDLGLETEIPDPHFRSLRGKKEKEENLFVAHLPTYLVDQDLLCVQEALK